MTRYQKNQRLITLAISILILDGAQDVQAQTFYVSPNGRDDNPGTESRPFQTIGKARDNVRAINRNMTHDIVVYLRGGAHHQDQAIVFDQRDSGSNGHYIVYKNYSGEMPVVSGGQRITGWQLDASKRWKARTNVDNFRQLYVNGRRAVRARGGALPGAEFYGNRAFKTTDVSMAQWINPGDIELVFDIQWERNICKVAGITPAPSGAILNMLEPYFTIARLKEGMQIGLPTHIENALELLDEPGEWYFNKATRWLYYMPQESEILDRTEVIAPALEKLLEVRGTLDKPVENLRFEGITFSHAGWNQPSVIGHVDLQANFTVGQQNLMFRVGREAARSGSEPAYLAHPHGEAIKSPSNIVLHAARQIRFERCTFTQLGGGGIDLEFGSQDNIISGCRFHDISGSAIQVGDVIDHHPKDARAIVKNNEIVNNYIHDVANEYLAGVGIFVGYTEGTRIAHNEISHLPYSGISMGWGWGEADAGGGGYWQPFYYEKPTVSKNNVCETNHIHHVMQQLWDGGAIYTLGNMPGSVIRGNHIHDNHGWPGGIYLDEGSGFIEVTGNVVYNVKGREQHPPTPMIYNNRRQNRITTCKEHDNYFQIKPGEKGFPQFIVGKAGLEPAYRDLL